MNTTVSAATYSLKNNQRVPFSQVLCLGAGLALSGVSSAPGGILALAAAVFQGAGSDLQGRVLPVLVLWTILIVTAVYSVSTERFARRWSGFGLIWLIALVNLAGHLVK